MSSRLHVCCNHKKHNWAFHQPQLRRNELSPLRACLPPKIVRALVTNQSMPSVFCEAITKKWIKNWVQDFSRDWVRISRDWVRIFPGIELGFFPGLSWDFSRDWVRIFFSRCLATIAFILVICLLWHVLWPSNHNYFFTLNCSYFEKHMTCFRAS